MKLPKIIQGGMGVAISDWNLARTVSMQGHLGVVSGTGIALIMISRLMEGDKEGHTRRALSRFPFQEPVQRILDKYFVPEPKTPRSPYKHPPMWTLNPSKALDELTVIGNFVEVFLAKEGHQNAVGLNLLEKLQMPMMASLYGAMLAEIDFVIIGAGIPVQIPGILDKLADHQAVSYRLDVQGAAPGDDVRLHFDPQVVFPGVVEKIGRLPRPYFLPIISSVVLGKALIKRATGKIDGFVVEAPTAGGHNAPPRGPMHLDEGGEPIYGKKDAVDFNKIKQLGRPFWLAGGYDSPEKLQYALDVGATGIQVGTAFGYCAESAMDETLKNRVIQEVLDQTIEVRTDPLVSPTGYPFKVVQLEGTLSDTEIYQDRIRVCDVGMLRHLYKRADGKVGLRCPAEPVEQYLAKGGELEDTVERGCLCNSLAAIAGFPQHRKDGYVEPSIITAGDGLLDIGKFIKPGHHSYTVRDVLDYLTG
ncbi:MAG: nitronate monooxygenase [Chloroflexota bacterium]|nr:nitronate monooxygenase [Chloroflexota bacterium]